MEFVKNFPFFSIILSMFAGIISSILNGKQAKRVCLSMIGIITVMSAMLLFYLNGAGESFSYMMGHYPAPWGNEIRAGILEALLALFFCVIMFISLLGGMGNIFEEVEDTKINLYFILIDLLLSSLLALIYTNDLFTAYVFVEINTIAACGLIMIRQVGRTTLAAVRYMVMSLLGSGLFLIGLSMLYDVTGHLLMPNAKIAVANILAHHDYVIPMVVVIALISVGLAIKSGLYPFHSWIPNAYGYSTAASSAILSGLVSKGYIILLIKIFYRVIGFEAFAESKIVNILFVFGIIGIIMGSISAMKENDIRRMIAYSSVAQIGYIYMGLGLGTKEGVIATLFHVLSHGVSKALLFIAAVGLAEVSGNSKIFRDLRGAGYRNKMAGVAFTVGALSMVGLPMFAGFISKLLFATAAVQSSNKMLITLIVLAVSTILNAVYFLRTVVNIYTPVDVGAESQLCFVTGSENPVLSRERFVKQESKGFKGSITVTVAFICFIILNFIMGMLSQPIVDMISRGLDMFS